MKFLRIFGLFVLVSGFVFGNAFSAGSEPSTVQSITLSANGGEPDNTLYEFNSTFYCDYEASKAIGINANIFTRCERQKPTKAGAGAFNGYYSDASGGTQMIDSDGVIIQENFVAGTVSDTWYAHYDEVVTNPCTPFMLKPAPSGFSGNNCLDYYTPTLHQQAPSIDNGCMPAARTGYTFGGYKDELNFTWYDNNLSPTTGQWPEYLCDADEVILTAIWNGNCNTISFNDNNVGDTNVNANNTQRKSTGEVAWLDVNPIDPNSCGKPLGTNPTAQIPTNANATFMGYYTTRGTSGSQIFDANGAATDYGTNTWTINTNTVLYAHWQCDAGYTWNEEKHTCDQKKGEAVYKCYTGDEPGVSDEPAIGQDYAVKPLGFYSSCENVLGGNFSGWLFSGDMYGTMHVPGDVISDWDYNDNQSFVPGYTATFSCDNNYWTGNSSSQLVSLGAEILVPEMTCTPKQEYVGWLDTTNTQWHATRSATNSPIYGESCGAGEVTANGDGESDFSYNCPTNLTFTPSGGFINRTIHLSCNGHEEDITVTYEQRNQISELVEAALNNLCGAGSCSAPSLLPHGHWEICSDYWPDGFNFSGLEDIGNGCYSTSPNYPHFDLTQLNQYWNQIGTFSISSIWVCPKYVKYQCNDDSNPVYNDTGAYTAYNGEGYSILTHQTVGCTDAAYNFVNWKLDGSDDTYYSENADVDPWPYETDVTLVAQWGDAKSYDITYYYDGTASWGTGNHPGTYTADDLPLTINAVMTRDHSIFVGWCDDAALTQNCAAPRTIPTGTTGDVHFYAKWECEGGYALDSQTGLCEPCPENHYSTGTQCVPCEDGFSAPAGSSDASACSKTCSVACVWNASVCPLNASCNPDMTSNPNNGTVNQTQQHDNGECYDEQTQQLLSPIECEFDFDCEPGYTLNTSGDVCVAKQYAVKYKCSVDDNNPYPDPTQAVFGQTYTILGLGDTGCTNEGHNFLGWQFGDIGTTYYQPGGIMWNFTDENPVFTAVWGDANTYTITYKPNYVGADQSDLTQTVTYGGTFFTPGAGTFHRDGYQMIKWGDDGTTPSQSYPLLGQEYMYNNTSNIDLYALWEQCAAGTYSVDSTCTDCPPEYPKSTQGASAISQCYKDCSKPCTTVACPEHSQCTQSSETYSGIEYYNSTCSAVPQACTITDITCDANYYLDGTTCKPCPDGYPHSDANATSQSQCYHDCETPCGTLEPCPEHAICTYGVKPNPGAWYYNTSACDARALECPVTAFICDDGYEQDDDHCEPCPAGTYGTGGVCTPCQDGFVSETGATACTPCQAGTYESNNQCLPCEAGYISAEAATACTPCQANTYWLNETTCEDCPEGYTSAQASTSIDQCLLSSCPGGQHMNHGECQDDVIPCDAPHATNAERTWNPALNAYGSCQILECEDGYHIASNACVPDDGLCTVPNGRGERTWNGTAWGACENVECDPGFTPNSAGNACERCPNYMGDDGQPAVSSYASGCEIASCMYQGQKYALINDNCEPICQTTTDDSGSKHWDNTQKKCVRTCNPGYKMW